MMQPPNACCSAHMREAASACPLDSAARHGHLADMENQFAAADPQSCATLADVRAGVDEVDRALVALIARRQGYMDAAARIKQSREAVRDEARIAEVLEKVQAEAWEQGLSWAIAEPVWRLLIERCIAHEFEVFDARAPLTQRAS
jgi:isochorismate pyruvate lyase